MKLCVGFITYNDSSAPYLPYFLPSLKAALSFLSPHDYKVLSYDNSSLDNHVNSRHLSDFCFNNEAFPLSSDGDGHNLGFSAAYNILIEKAVLLQAEYFLVINPDTILDEEAIKKMLQALELKGCLASVSPRIMSWDFKNLAKNNKIDSLGIVLKPGLKFIDAGQGETYVSGKRHSMPGDILGPSGAAALFRLSALIAVSEKRGGKRQFFDERFFMYKEDCDLAYRLFLAGYQSALVEEALIYHDRTTYAVGSTYLDIMKSRQQKSRQVRIWSFHNQHLLFVKYFVRQNFRNQMIISGRIFVYFIFSLIFERFLLKEYPKIS